MSILRKIPKIEQVLDNMSLESLKRLESLMNSGNGATDTYTLFGGENKLNYVNKDLGVWYCNIELERNKSVETGFLIWESETKALFISYDITQCLKEYEIDLTNYTYTKINEKLSIEEFRRVLEDNINKEVVHIDTTGNVEIGKNLVVDGKVILNGKEDLVDTSGNELISDSGGGKGLNILSLNLKDCMNESDYNELVGYILQKTVIAKTYNITLPDLTDVDIVNFTVETPNGNMNTTFYRNSKAITQFNWLCNWADDENFIQMVTITGYTDNNVKYIKYNGIDSGGSEIKNVVVNGEEFTWDVSQVNVETDKIINSSLFGIMNLAIVDGNNYGYSQVSIVYDDTMGATISYYRLKLDGSVEYINTSLLIQKDNYKNDQCSIYIISSNGAKAIDFLTVPALPSDANTKTYVLKAVNGVLTWVEG